MQERKRKTLDAKRTLQELWRNPGWAPFALCLLPFACAAVLVSAALGQSYGGQLSYSSMLQVVAFDPISNINLATAQLSALMFETLVERNPHGSGVVPML